MLPRSAILFRRIAVHRWSPLQCTLRIKNGYIRTFSTDSYHVEFEVPRTLNQNLQCTGLFTLSDSEGIYYSGNVLNGKYNGKGTCTIHQNETYTGDFVDGKRCGNGKAVYHKKSVDTTLIADTSSKELALHAFGSASLDKSNTDNLISYEGEWKDDKYHGHGILLFKHGSKYDGSFVEGRFQGSAEYTFENGDVYVGMFYDDTACGRGQFTSADGDVYVGDFAGGVFHGQGKYDMNNGMSYEGEWQNGMMHGQGRLYSREHEGSNLFKGRFELGEFIEGEGPPPGTGGDGSSTGEEQLHQITIPVNPDNPDDEVAHAEMARAIKQIEKEENETNYKAQAEMAKTAHQDGDDSNAADQDEPEETLSPKDEQLAREIAEELQTMSQEAEEEEMRARTKSEKVE